MRKISLISTKIIYFYIIYSSQAYVSNKILNVNNDISKFFNESNDDNKKSSKK